MINPINYYYNIRSYVSAYTHFVKGAVLWSLIWVIALAVVIWLYGPTLAINDVRPFESVAVRLSLILILFVAWAIYAVYQWLKRRQADAAMAEDITANSEDDKPKEPNSAEEGRILQDRLRDALKTLRKNSGGARSYVYDMPWYMLVGAPGTGKTTTLLNSGLKFPVMGDDAESIFVRGIGGTRHCDWWFAEDAILIDTAGRFTTQEGNSTVDRDSWQTFLALLRKHRPLQPINGAVVAISVESLLASDPRERLMEARTIRRRINELHEAFNLQIPVYVVITKMDMLKGFRDFYDYCDRYEREQVWGMTLPLDKAEDFTAAVKQFTTEYDLLLERINGLLLERMQHEQDRDRRGPVFGFPTEFARLKDALVEMVSEITLTPKGQKLPRLRGLYFVSATQEGADFEAVRQRIVGGDYSLARARADEQKCVARSYFISRLFHEVIFNEAALVSTDPKLLRRRQRIQQIGIALAATVVVAVFCAWGFGYVANRQALAETERRLNAYNQLARELETRRADEVDFATIVTTLNRLEISGEGFGQAEPYGLASLGLSQAPKVKTQLGRLYSKALNRYYLPRIMQHLQGRILDAQDDPARLFPLLKTYLMLGSAGAMDQHMALVEMARAFETAFPGEAQSAFKADLNRHFKALVNHPMEAVPLDDSIIGMSRASLQQQPVIERVLYSLVQSAPARALAEWKITSHISAAGASLLKRRSEAPLSQGIAGIYTGEGYRQVIVPMLDNVTAVYENDAWVYGKESTPVPPDLKQQVTQLYAQQFSAVWRDLISDIEIRTFRDFADAANGLSGLGQVNNPLQMFAIAIAEATDTRSEQQRAIDSLSNQTKSSAPSLLSADKLIVTQAGLPEPYINLRSFVAKVKDEDQTPYNEVNALVGQLYAEVSRAAMASSDTQHIFGTEGRLNNAIQNLLSEARRMPAPVSDWMAGLGVGVSRLAAKGTRENATMKWNSEGLPICQNAIAGRYPFDRSAANDVPFNDFVRLFAPDGLFDSFYRENLAGSVDTTTNPWSWRETSGGQSVPSSALVQFQHAAEIREAFFAMGAKSPSITLDVTPVSLDTASSSVNLDIAGTNITYAHGPRRSFNVNWPGEGGDYRARVAFQPEGYGTAITKSGAWALFRLIDAGRITIVSDSSFNLSLNAGGRSAAFTLSPGTVRNPFTLSALRQFKCPVDL